MDDTIAAISTAPGASAIGMIRISGPESLAILKSLIPSSSTLEPKRVKTGWVVRKNPQGAQEKIDYVLYYYFISPYSYTGEDMVEICGHGGTKNMQRLLQCVFEQGARPAKPGEFTLRAFLRGKIDLVQAEAVLSVVNARSERALKAAHAQLDGVLTREIESIREVLVSELAGLEASIDFPDDVNNFSLDLRKLEDAVMRLEKLTGSWNRSRTIAEGLRVVLTGRPNAGKSSLFNAILGRKRAIVDSEPGTTRDYIEATMELEGQEIILIDTAGLRKEAKGIELKGIELTKEAIKNADIVLVLVDETGITGEEYEVLKSQAEGKVLIPVLTKIDLGWKPPESVISLFEGNKYFSVSSITGEGIAELESRLVEIAGSEFDPGEPILTNLRHFNCTVRAIDSIKKVIFAKENAFSEEIIASHLKESISFLDEITGRNIVTDLLDEIFSKFCIGK